MKKIFSLFAIISFLSVKAQITVDHDWSSLKSYPYKVTFTNSSEKFYILSQFSDSIQIYNYDGSLYKQIILPPNNQYIPFKLLDRYISYPSDAYFNLIPSLSDNLFDNDGNIEFLTSQLAGDNTVVHIVDETGNIKYTFPDTIPYGPVDARIFKFDNAYKLAFTCTTQVFKVYALPGSLPCNACSLTNGITQPDNSSSAEKEMISAYPNPFNQTLMVDYSLHSKKSSRLILTDIQGKVLKTVILEGQSDKVLLDTANLPKGIILVSLYGDNQDLLSKKVVKIE